jgi:hypothetical protein
MMSLLHWWGTSCFCISSLSCVSFTDGGYDVFVYHLYHVSPSLMGDMVFLYIIFIMSLLHWWGTWYFCISSLSCLSFTDGGHGVFVYHLYNVSPSLMGDMMFLYIIFIMSLLHWWGIWCFYISSLSCLSFIDGGHGVFVYHLYHVSPSLMGDMVFLYIIFIMSLLHWWGIWLNTMSPISEGEKW